MLLNVSLPTLVEVRDYHELQEMELHFKELNGSIKVAELSFNGTYIGVVYVGKKPSKEEISKLAKKMKIDIEDY